MATPNSEREIDNTTSNKFVYRIVSQEFDANSNKQTIKLEKNGLSELIEMTAIQITLNKDIVSQLNPQDALRIGYITATEQMLMEKEKMEKLKK